MYQELEMYKTYKEEKQIKHSHEKFNNEDILNQKVLNRQERNDNIH